MIFFSKEGEYIMSEEYKKIYELGKIVREIIDGKKSLFNDQTTENIFFSIMRFNQLKEKSINKRMIDGVNYYLDFNLNDNKHMIWDMLFLSKVITKQITDPASIYEILKKINYTNLLGHQNNQQNLSSEEENKIKESVVIYQKVRDSLSHNLGTATVRMDDEEKTYIIKNNHFNNRLDCKIPYQYIEKFGKGIIPLEDHREIATEIDKLTSNIYFKLGFNMKEIPNLFYRTNPKKLKFLLEKACGEIENLKELPTEVFYNECSEERLEYLLEKANGEIENLKELPPVVFSSSCSEERLEYLLEKANGELSKLKELPIGVFYNTCSEERLEYLLKKANGELSKLKDLPIGVFYNTCSKERLEYLLEKVNGELSKLKDLPIGVFYNTCSKERLEYLLKKANGELSKLKDLPTGVFYNTCSKERLEYLLEKVNGELSKLKELPIGVFYNECSEERLEYLLEKVNGEIENLKELPTEVFNNECSEERLEYLLEKANGELSKLKDLPIGVFYNECSEERLEYLLEKANGEIEKLKDLPPVVFSSSCSEERLEYLLEKANGELSKLKDLPIGVFYNTCSKERLEYLLEKANGELSKLKDLPQRVFNNNECSKERLEYLLEKVNGELSKLKELPIGVFNNECSEERLEYLLEKVNGELSKLKDLRIGVFYNTCSKERLEYLLEKANGEIEKLKDLPIGVFYNECSEERLEYLLEKVNGELSKLKDLPIGVFSFNCSEERLEYLLEKANGELSKLTEIPSELFTCNQNVFEELYNTHEMNMIKSILGIGDEKQIALMVYMNAVFSKYQQEIENEYLDTTNITIETRTETAKNDEIKIQKTLKEIIEKIKKLQNLKIQTNSRATLGAAKGIILSITPRTTLDKKIKETNDEIKNRIGNSARHFRIEPTDKNTIVLEDYTKEADGIKKLAFRAKTTIKDLFQITHSLITKDPNNEKIKEQTYSYSIIQENYKQAKAKILKKIIMQMCLEKENIINITETIENDIVYFEFILNNEKIKVELEELYQYYKECDMDKINDAIIKCNNELKQKGIDTITLYELDEIYQPVSNKKKIV